MTLEDLVNSENWRWLPGMQVEGIGSEGPIRVLRVDDLGNVLLAWRCEVAQRSPVVMRRGRPVIEDPATKGAMLKLAREAYGDLVSIGPQPGHPQAPWAMILARVNYAPVYVMAETEGMAIALAVAGRWVPCASNHPEFPESSPCSS